MTPERILLVEGTEESECSAAPGCSQDHPHNHQQMELQAASSNASVSSSLSAAMLHPPLNARVANQTSSGRLNKDSQKSNGTLIKLLFTTQIITGLSFLSAMIPGVLMVSSGWHELLIFCGPCLFWTLLSVNLYLLLSEAKRRIGLKHISPLHAAIASCPPIVIVVVFALYGTAYQLSGRKDNVELVVDICYIALFIFLYWLYWQLRWTWALIKQCYSVEHSNSTTGVKVVPWFPVFRSWLCINIGWVFYPIALIWASVAILVLHKRMSKAASSLEHQKIAPLK